MFLPLVPAFLVTVLCTGPAVLVDGNHVSEMLKRD